MDKHLHIVSFDYPYPPNYGGIIDVFYKIKALVQCGVRVHLHYFAHQANQENDELNQLCEQVYFYPRSSISLPQLFKGVPLRMQFRRNQALLDNLTGDDYPILFEGLYTTYLAQAEALAELPKFMRTHNIERDYFNHLARLENNLLYRTAYRLESKLSARLENNLASFDKLFVLNPGELSYFSNRHPDCHILPIFHQNNQVEIPPGIGKHILFHGNLSVAENAHTALWIRKHIAPHFLEQRFVIAGKNPSPSLMKQLDFPNITTLANLSQKEHHSC